MIKVVDAFAVVAVSVAAHVSIDVVDSVLMVNTMYAVVSVSLAVVVRVLDHRWCSLSCFVLLAPPVLFEPPTVVHVAQADRAAGAAVPSIDATSD